MRRPLLGVVASFLCLAVSVEGQTIVDEWSSAQPPPPSAVRGNVPLTRIDLILH